ncbi:MAG: NAD(P)-binding domain-containing protein [Myxococcota bacterium]|nr:NAD(P)-binding domain-containing protein [Myxococcota bacterium]
MPVGVVGGGPFGRALAVAAARNGRSVLLWSRRAPAAPAPGIVVTDDASALERAELVLVAVPSPHIASIAAMLSRWLDGRHLLVHASRGLEGDGLRPLSHVLRERTAVRRVGVLAGPIVAAALEAGAPLGGIVGTLFGEVEEAVRAAIGGPTLRLYATRDVVGVEVAAAMVGLLSLAAGFCRGIGVGPGSLAVLLSRGMAEARRIGQALGAEARTFEGLAGHGDLLAAVAGDERPEVRLGRALARGLPLAEAVREAGAHIEGVSIARRVQRFAARAGLEAPVSATIADVIDGSLGPEGAIARLMARPAGLE